MDKSFKFKRVWSWQSVREACIKYEWYTEGTNEDYHEMLMFVETHKPIDSNITKVAKDIFNHSEKDGRDITTVAFALAKEAVMLLLVEEDW